jgi:hypothetical protein
VPNNTYRRFATPNSPASSYLELASQVIAASRLKTLSRTVYVGLAFRAIGCCGAVARNTL